MPLTITLPSGEGVRLDRGYHLVGHGGPCAIALRDPRVSRHHCLIQVRADRGSGDKVSGHGASLIDLASADGTYLNGRRLTPLAPFSLASGDEIGVGDAMLGVTAADVQRIAVPSAVQLPLLPCDEITDGASADAALLDVVAGSGAPGGALSLVRDAVGLGPEHEAFSEESFDRLTDLSRRLKFLNDFSNSVAGLFDPDEALRFVMANAMKLIPADSGIVFLRRGQEMVAKLYWRSGRAHAIRKARCSRRLLRKVIDERVGLIFREPRAVTGGPRLATMMIPLLFEDELLGVMALHSSPERPEFTRADLILLSGLAKQIAVHLENARLVEEIRQNTADRERIKRELEIGAAIQRDALPSAPVHLVGVGCASLCIPAQEVGGDFVDFVEHPDGAVGICVGDVMGKGLPAALFMMEVKSILHSCALTERDPSKVLWMANRLVCKKAAHSLRMATVCYAIIDADRRSFTYASAGHCPALVLRGGRVLGTLEPTGMMLGVDPASTIRAERCHLASEHALFMYTDGAVDARNQRGEPVGAARLAAIAAAHSHAEPHRAIAGIQQEIARFAEGADLLDDLTMAWATIRAPAE